MALVIYVWLKEATFSLMSNKSVKSIKEIGLIRSTKHFKNSSHVLSLHQIRLLILINYNFAVLSLLTTVTRFRRTFFLSISSKSMERRQRKCVIWLRVKKGRSVWFMAFVRERVSAMNEIRRFMSNYSFILFIRHMLHLRYTLDCWILSTLDALTHLEMI